MCDAPGIMAVLTRLGRGFVGFLCRPGAMSPLRTVIAISDRMPEIGKEVFRIFDAVDLYPHLQDLTDMKPVVVNPSISFEQLVNELVAEDQDTNRDIIRQQLAVKLRRRIKNLPPEARQRFEAVAGETPPSRGALR